MPSTYEPIATQTLGSATNSVTFSSISGTYTDLVLVANYGITASGYGLRMRLGNGSVDSGSNYSDTTLCGTGSVARSSQNSSVTSIVTTDPGLVSNSFSSIMIINLNNYSNTTTYKTAMLRQNAADAEATAIVGLWRSTSAINTINLFVGSGNILAGSTFTLYGIKAA